MTKQTNTDEAARRDGSALERQVGRPRSTRANARTRPCPNPTKGQRCPLCGGEWVCLQSWRPKALAPVNRYCRAGMCLETDAEHEPWCERNKTMKPLNGKKTHPLTTHAIGVLVRLSHGPQPRLTVNPGTVNRLLRGALVESVDLPSPYKSHNGQRIEHLRLTKAGHDAAMASHKTPNAAVTGPAEGGSGGVHS